MWPLHRPTKKRILSKKRDSFVKGSNFFGWRVLSVELFSGKGVFDTGAIRWLSQIKTPC